MTSGSKSSQNYNVQDVVGQTATGLLTSQGYTIQSGFPYLSGVEPFRFSLSTTKVDFGKLSPFQPITKQIQAIVDNGLSSGYQVFAVEVGPLTSDTKAIIRHTKCDQDNNRCTSTTARSWRQNGVVGFGYGLVGNSIPEDFKDSSYFRPFADLSQGQDPIVIMSSRAHKVRHQTTINFRVNISSTQPVGNYRNTIIFTAIPGY